MSYLMVEDFRGGLDSRKSAFTSPAGTLLKLTNAHINRGGEIEKRKAFVPVCTFTGPASHELSGLVSKGDSLNTFVTGGVHWELPTRVTVTPVGTDSNKMTRIIDSAVYNGVTYAVAQFEDGRVNHFYNGANLAEWTNGTVGLQNISDLTSAASYLANCINTDPAYSAYSVGQHVIVSAVEVDKPFTYAFSTIKMDGTASAVTGTWLDTNWSGWLAYDGYAIMNGFTMFNITAFTPGLGNGVTALTKDGVDVIDYANQGYVGGSSIATLASNLVSRINSVASANLNGFHAWTPGGYPSNVGVYGPPAYGSRDYLSFEMTLNGGTYTATKTAGTEYQVADGTHGQTVTLELGGTFSTAALYSVSLTMDGETKHFGAKGDPFLKGVCCVAMTSKMYTSFGNVVYFSKLNDPANWASSNTGAGSVSISAEAGAENIMGLAIYNKNLAIFTRSTVQIYQVYADTSKNSQLQVLRNIGTRSPRSVASYGGTDVYFLAETGIRSLKPRDTNMDIAATNDVGTAIDTIVRSHMDTLPPTTVSKAVAIVEPIDGRYWLALGNKIYVLSYFPASKVSAWSTYETYFDIDDMCVAGDRVYILSGDKVYLYGGEDGNTYESCFVEVQLPYLDMKQPATLKQLTGVDVGAVNTWELGIYDDPNMHGNSNANFLRVGYVTGNTYPYPNIALPGWESSHFSVKLTNTGSGPALISNLGLHYDSGASG